MPTIAHISDLHLQSGKPARQAQVEPILQKINEMKPDLVVISGDVTDDGWDSIEELKWAKRWLEERLEVVWWAVPGNHDVGNFASLSEGKIDDARVENWQIGFKAFELPVNFGVLGNWAIIFVNSMLFGSGLDTEKVYRERLERELAMVQDRLSLVAIMHSPLFIEESDESIIPAAEYWIGPKATRLEIWNRLQQAGVKLIGSGHVHQSRLNDVEGVTIAWAPPASGTWVNAPGLPNPPMPEKTGFFLHHLHDDGRVETELVECAPMLKCIEFNPWP
jgi:3',5'-cyclic AMP phosphodiesterase CpdA